MPVLNFWRPKQTANDIWSASDSTAEGKHLGSPLLTWWWLCFLLAKRGRLDRRRGRRIRVRGD